MALKTIPLLFMVVVEFQLISEMSYVCIFLQFLMFAYASAKSFDKDNISIINIYFYFYFLV